MLFSIIDYKDHKHTFFLIFVFEIFESIAFYPKLLFNHRLFFLITQLLVLLTLCFPLLSDCITTFSWLPEHVTLLARFSGELSL